jgi:DUF917 family protein
MFYLEKKNLESYLLGSLFFGTGGGFSYEKHLKVAKRVFKLKERIIIKDLNEFKDGDFLVSAYGVGDPSRAKTTTSQEWQSALFAYEQKTANKIKGIIPGEIGAEFLAMQAAASLNLPLVDTDLVGGRAAPEINLDCFGVFKKAITPILCILPNGKSIFLEGNFTSKEVENISRDFFDQGGGSGILVGYGCYVKDLKNFFIPSTISLTKQVGEYLEKKEINLILKKLEAKIVFSGKITKITLKSRNGFFSGHIDLGKFRVAVKNENIILFYGKKIIAQVPDLIVLLDKELRPIHNSEIIKMVGEDVSAVKIPAQGYWRNKKGKKIWDGIVREMRK